MKDDQSHLDDLLDDVLHKIELAGADPTDLLFEQDNEQVPAELAAMIERAQRICGDDPECITDALMSDVNYQRIMCSPALHDDILLKGLLSHSGSAFERPKCRMADPIGRRPAGFPKRRC